MGNSSQKVDTTKITHCGKNQQMEFICMEMRGWRKQMQDSAIYDLQIETPASCLDFKNSLFAVFDGHGTSYISRFLKQNFLKVLISTEQYQKQNYVEALQNTFKKLDQLMLTTEGQLKLKQIKLEEDENCQQSKYHPVGEKIGFLCGSTANVVLITKNFYYIANTGDSRSVLCRSGYTIVMSNDHKPQNPSQLKRIRKANGFVNHGRINDMLSVSRAFGDFEFKRNTQIEWSQQMVTCKPDIKVFGKSNRDDFIMIACDGIWQNTEKSNSIIQIFIKQKSFKKQNYQLALEQLLNKLIAKDQSQQLGQDNMTAIFVKFLKHNLTQNQPAQDDLLQKQNHLQNVQGSRHQKYDEEYEK